MIEDRRTEEQKQKLKYFVMGTDTFLSGWGRAKDGISYAVWFCETKEQRQKLTYFVKSRSDMKRVLNGSSEQFESLLKRKPFMDRANHISIYVCDENHRAFTKK
tara:strand:- start:392 stop:703 length:312 start_codon:yes stop_codon:yes gene_type:complete